jgi:hypothetical protein
MINIGDIIAVTLMADSAFFGSSDNAGQLQTKLQQLGFRVVNFNDSGLNTWSGLPGQLLVTVQPLVSAYRNQSDVASIVAGAAYDAGYYITDYSSQVVQQAAPVDQGQIVDYGNAVNPWDGQPAVSQQSGQQISPYEQNLQTPLLPSQSNANQSNTLSDALSRFGEGLGAGSTVAIVLVAVIATVILKR